MTVFNVPTGKIIIDKYQHGLLETLSIGDYGKEHNIKANFLGYSRELNCVTAREIKPLQEKWVMTLSTQYGCRMKCKFCDAYKIENKKNATVMDFMKQIKNARDVFSDVPYTDRLNIHFARIGEPLFNFSNVYTFTMAVLNDKKYFESLYNLRVETIHPVLTTMLPKAISDEDTTIMLELWCNLKNKYFNGQAGLQLSINTTDDKGRDFMFSKCSKSLNSIAKICDKLPEPIGRKYCLNFAYDPKFEIDANKLANLFDNNKFMVKITPIHNTEEAITNNITTPRGYESYLVYKDVENALLNVGFDVIVFIPSFDEEYGCITCGNAILGIKINK